MANAPNVAIVADSSIGLRPQRAEELGLRLVPFQLIVDGASLRDTLDLSATEFFKNLDGYEQLPSTSAPSPGAYLDAYNAAWTQGMSVVTITCAATMTASHRSAVVAAEDAAQPTVVVDSRNAAAGELLVTTAALRAAESGASVTETARVAKEVAGRVKLLATIETFKFLKRSGRVNALEAFAATALGIKPIFLMRDGEAKSYAKTRKRTDSLERIVEDLNKEVATAGDAKLHVASGHAGCFDDGKWLLDAVSDLEPVESIETEFTPVMGVHTGPGLVGLAWWWEPSEGL